MFQWVLIHNQTLITCSCMNYLLPTQIHQWTILPDNTATFFFLSLQASLLQSAIFSCNNKNEASLFRSRWCQFQHCASHYVSICRNIWLPCKESKKNNKKHELELNLNLNLEWKKYIQKQQPSLHKLQWGCCPASQRVTVADTRAWPTLSKTH